MGIVEVSGEGGKNYCVFRLAEGEKEDTFVLGMLNNNKIKNCIQPQILHQGMGTLYRYNISGMLPLHYIYQDYMSRKVFLGIIESILDALIDLAEYMITPANILWDYKNIFVDQKTNKANLICVPENMDGTEYDIYSFFREFIFQARLDMSENGAYHSELIRFLNTSNAGSFSKEDFLVLIHRLSESAPVRTESAQPRPVQGQPVVEKKAPQPVNSEPIVQKPVAAPPVQEAPQAPASEPYSNYQPKYAQPMDVPAPEEAPEKEEKGGRSNFFGMLKGRFKGMQSSLENEEDEDDMDIPGASPRPPKPSAPAPAPTPAPVQQEKRTPAPAQAAAPSPVLPPNNHTVYFEPESDVGTRTVMLDESTVRPHGVAKLIRKKNQEEIPIKVKNGAFRIGHSTSSPLEYRITDNPYIGGFHAQIIFKDEQYYLMDMNSTNGTYLDGERIYINQEKLLVSGQKIKLANEEFEFEIES